MSRFTPRLIASLAMLSTSACGSGNQNSSSGKESAKLKVVADQNTTSFTARHFLLDDIDHDGTPDTGVCVMRESMTPDSTIIPECMTRGCTLELTFGSGLPRLVVDLSVQITAVDNIGDIDSDSTDELLVYSRWQDGYWQNLQVWSLHNRVWTKKQAAKAFISNDADYAQRIIRENGKVYLLADVWDDTFAEIRQRDLRIQISPSWSILP